MIIAPIIRILFKLYQSYQAKQGNAAAQVTGAQPGQTVPQSEMGPQARPGLQAQRPSDFVRSTRGSDSRRADREQRRAQRREARAWR